MRRGILTMEISNEAKIKTKIDNEQKEINLTSDEKITTALTINTDGLSQES